MDDFENPPMSPHNLNLDSPAKPIHGEGGEEERESRNVYSVDMKLCATIYVKASNKKE